MTKWKRAALILVGLWFVPAVSHAQGAAAYVGGLQGVLDQLYSEMIPLCSSLIGVSRGIAGFAATWYIAARVWRHIANAEPVDFYPLFRPFVLGFCILIFPTVLAMINGIMKPTVSATARLVKDSDKAIALLLKRKQEAIKKTDAWQMYVGINGQGDRDRWYKYTHGEDSSSEGMLESIGNDLKFSMAKASYSFRNSVKEWMSEVLRLLFEAAALCINTIRTFQMIVLAILGPLAFGIAVFDGFQHTLTAWIARYLNVFLWLPVANIFGGIIGKIQENMLKLDLSQINLAGDTFFSRTDAGYLIFLIIGIVGYFTVPSIANYIIHAGGSAFVHRTTSMYAATTSMATGAAGAVSWWGVNKVYDSMKGSSQEPAAAAMGERLKGNS